MLSLPLRLTVVLLYTYTVLTIGSRSSSGSDSDSDSDDQSQTTSTSTSAPSAEPVSCPLILHYRSGGNAAPSAASYLYEDPMDIGVAETVVDFVLIQDYTIISFDIQIDPGFVCPDAAGCHILTLGDDLVEFPSMTLTDSEFQVYMQEDSRSNSETLSSNDTTVMEEIVNGDWHRITWVFFPNYYFNFPPSRYMYFNGRKVFDLPFDPTDFDVTSAIGSDGLELDILIGADTSNQIPGSIRNLCVRTVNLEDWIDTATTTATPTTMNFAAGSNQRSVIGSDWNLHSEIKSESEPRTESETMTVTLSTATWINLWGIIAMILLCNLVLAVWCMERRKEVEYE